MARYFPSNPIMMQKARSLHLYLGCIFAPMLLFFAISGIWQTYGPAYTRSATLTWLSTIHTMHPLKAGNGLTSPLLRYFVLGMAASFVLSIFLGIVMALRFGRNRTIAVSCLAFGLLFPLGVVLNVCRQHEARSGRLQGPDTTVAGLAFAAGNGDTNAINRLEVLASDTTPRQATSSDRGDKFRDFRLAFDNLGWRAGQGNDHALEALSLATQFGYLQGFAVDGLGKAAGMGNQKALALLVHPEASHILFASVVPALEPAADNGNQKAIEVLAAVAADPQGSGDWYMAAEGLQKAAAVAGNATAIDALGRLAKNGNENVRRLAVSTLQSASSNHCDRAAEVLHQLNGQ